MNNKTTEDRQYRVWATEGTQKVTETTAKEMAEHGYAIDKLDAKSGLWLPIFDRTTFANKTTK